MGSKAGWDGIFSATASTLTRMLGKLKTSDIATMLPWLWSDQQGESNIQGGGIQLDHLPLWSTLSTRYVHSRFQSPSLQSQSKADTWLACASLWVGLCGGPKHPGSTRPCSITVSTVCETVWLLPLGLDAPVTVTRWAFQAQPTLNQEKHTLGGGVHSAGLVPQHYVNACAVLGARPMGVHSHIPGCMFSHPP